MLITPLTRQAHLSVERCAEDLQSCTHQAQRVSEDIENSTFGKLMRPRYILLVFASGLLLAQLLNKKTSTSKSTTTSSAKKAKAPLFSSTQLFSFFVSIWVMLSKTRDAEKAVGEVPVESLIKDRHS